MTKLPDLTVHVKSQKSISLCWRKSNGKRQEQNLTSREMGGFYGEGLDRKMVGFYRDVWDREMH
jgi:hypothetical protein